MPDFFKLVHEWHVETKYGKWAPTQKEAFGSTWFLVSKWDRGWVKFVNDGKSLDLRKGKQGGECSSKFLDQLKVKRFEAASALMTEALSMMEDQDENQDPPTKKAKTDKHGKRHLKQALKDEAMRPQIVTMDMPPLKADDSHVQLSGVQMRVLTECMFEGKFWIELNSSNLMYLLTACRTSQSTRIEGEEKSKEEVADSDLASAQKGGAWRQSNDLEIIITSRIQALSSKELVWMPAGCFHASAVECTTAGFAAGIYAAVPYHQHHIVEGMWKIKTNCWHQFKLKTIRVFTNYYSTFTYICVYIYIYLFIFREIFDPWGWETRRHVSIYAAILLVKVLGGQNYAGCVLLGSIGTWWRVPSANPGLNDALTFTCLVSTGAFTKTIKNIVSFSQVADDDMFIELGLADPFVEDRLRLCVDVLVYTFSLITCLAGQRTIWRIPWWTGQFDMEQQKEMEDPGCTRWGICWDLMTNYELSAWRSCLEWTVRRHTLAEPCQHQPATNARRSFL